MRGMPCEGFLAATPGHPAMAAWVRETRACWIGSPPRLRESPWRQTLLGRVILLVMPAGDERSHPRAVCSSRPLLAPNRWIRRNPSVWVSPLFGNVIKTAPYGWLVRLFRHLHGTSAEVREIWDATPKVSGANVLRARLASGELSRPLPDDDPVFFRDWMQDRSWAGVESVLLHLLATLPADPPIRLPGTAGTSPPMKELAAPRLPDSGASWLPRRVLRFVKTGARRHLPRSGFVQRAPRGQPRPGGGGCPAVDTVRSPTDEAARGGASA